MNRLLIIEDDADVADALARTLASLGCRSDVAASGTAALAALERAVFDVVLLDLGLPDREGLEALDAILARDPLCRVIVVTGRNDATLAVGALQRGAVDYLVKPWDRHALRRVVGGALGEVRLRREMAVARLQLERDALQAVGASPPWLRAVDELRAAAQSPRAPVLISGESGTGKDVAAQLAHRWSPRAAGPFVTVNAACLPAAMLESELFGHEAGAFTGARGVRRGLFELATGGTLFLDEIGELPLDLQPKLLRVLEGHGFRRLGGEREIRADVRLVAATNRDLPEMIRGGRFREDLYYRLSVLDVHLPPLRDRPGDARALALHFADSIAQEMGRAGGAVEHAALEALARYDWPGNVRELRNVVERGLVLAGGSALALAHLPAAVRGACAPRRRASGVHATQAAAAEPADLSLAAAVRAHVLSVYDQHAGNLSRTAAALGITRVALRRKLREFGAYTEPRGAPARAG